jgi:hypothetical protein
MAKPEHDPGLDDLLALDGVVLVVDPLGNHWVKFVAKRVEPQLFADALCARWQAPRGLWHAHAISSGPPIQPKAGPIYAGSAFIERISDDTIMISLLKVLPSLPLITLVAALSGQIEESYNNEPSCGGRRYDLATVSGGAAPYITLVADGVSGQFLLDYGATKSSLSTIAFAASDGSIASLSLPGFTRRSFELKRYVKPLQPAQGQIGVIGTDLLSSLTVELNGNAAFLGEQGCQPEQLRAQHLIPIAQKGLFSSRPSEERELPNVPIVFVRLGEIRTWAQIDTGYEDLVYAHSVDINEAFFEQLRKSKAELTHIGDIEMYTCENRETRHVYTSKDVPL